MQTGDLDALMNGQIKKQLGIPDNVTWGGKVFVLLIFVFGYCLLS